MLIPVNHAQINWRFSGLNAPFDAEVTMGVNTELLTVPETEVADDLATVWFNSFRARQVSSIELSLVRVKFGPNDIGPSFEAGASMPGAFSGQAESPQVSCLVSKATGVGGRAGRGRMYVPGVPAANYDDSGLMDSASRTSWQGSADDFIDGLVALGLVPVLLHAPGSPITQPLPITAFTVQARAATQRRRLRR